MRAMDIMTTKVVTASPANSIRQAARLMYDRGISGLPVVDDRAQLVGIITEGDLLRRSELGGDRLPSADEQPRAYVRSHSWNVGDVMTTDVVTVGEEASVSYVAALMLERGIKRLPVMREGKLIGIVSRADLLRAIVTAKLDDTASGDEAIRRSVLTRLGDIGEARSRLGVTVKNGLVHLWGSVRSASERDAARVVAEGVRGVVGAVDHMDVVAIAGDELTKGDEADAYLQSDR